MTIKRLNAQTYELEGKNRDFHIRSENGQWRVDSFDSTVKANDEAYLDTIDFDSLNEAIDYCFGREAVVVVFRGSKNLG